MRSSRKPGQPRAPPPTNTNAPPPIPVPPMTARMPCPPNWEQHLATAGAQVPFPFTCTSVDPSSAEFREIQRLFGATPSSIDRVINPELWRRFTRARTDLLTSKSDDPTLLKDLGLTEQDIAHRMQVANGNHGPYIDNIVLLFHGSRADRGGSIEKILAQGLDERLGHPGTLGRGIYFSDDPSKAMQYDSHGVLIVFAVMLGDCLALDGGGQTRSGAVRVREPEKYDKEKRNPQDLFFDSIVARPGSANEYVIFNRYLCYPVYTIAYPRSASRMRRTVQQRRLKRTADPALASARAVLPPFAWGGGAREAGASPFHAATIFGAMEAMDSDPNELGQLAELGFQEENGNMGAEEAEECQICSEEVPPPSQYWEMLGCNHKICKICAGRLTSVGTTMSGATHTFLKCPFCQFRSGIQIGDCPTGKLSVRKVRTPPAGFAAGSLSIRYLIRAGRHSVNRIAYLPDNPEGRRVLELLRTAWDRRLIFTIGTSMTNGAEDVLVWNIHHKTALVGGGHGYPDPTYLERVLQELNEYGIQ